MPASRSFCALLTLLLSGCAERQLLDSSRPAIVGQAENVSQRDITRVTEMARQRLAESDRGSHAIYRVEIVQPNMIFVYHAQPPKYADDCLEELLYDRIKDRWQLRDMEIVCGANIPTG